MSLKPYSKKALPITDQIALLEQRGISISDQGAAGKFLTWNNYYYISGYVFYFEKQGAQRTHQLSHPTSFTAIQELVYFDQNLRNNCWQAIQTIEFAIRSSIARNLSLYHGPFCLEQAGIFAKRSEFPNHIVHLYKTLQEHKNLPFITHFTDTYQETLPPIWVMIELFTFGTVSCLYGSLNTIEQKAIAQDFCVDHIVLVSWLKAITELRNTCAHHMRLWNKVFVNAPKLRHIDKSFPL